MQNVLLQVRRLASGNWYGVLCKEVLDDGITRYGELLDVIPEQYDVVSVVKVGKQMVKEHNAEEAADSTNHWSLRGEPDVVRKLPDEDPTHKLLIKYGESKDGWEASAYRMEDDSDVFTAGVGGRETSVDALVDLKHMMLKSLAKGQRRPYTIVDEQYVRPLASPEKQLKELQEQNDELYARLQRSEQAALDWHTRATTAERKIDAVTRHRTGLTRIDKVETHEIIVVSGIMGDGVDAPVASIKQYWTTDGYLIGVRTPYGNNETPYEWAAKQPLEDSTYNVQVQAVEAEEDQNDVG